MMPDLPLWAINTHDSPSDQLLSEASPEHGRCLLFYRTHKDVYEEAKRRFPDNPPSHILEIALWQLPTILQARQLVGDEYVAFYSAGKPLEFENLGSMLTAAAFRFEVEERHKVIDG
jgi:hypothetical protein